MTGRNGTSIARVGAQTEREFETLAAGLLGLPARRKLGAGRRDDHGDIDLIPGTCVQVTRCAADTLHTRARGKLAAVAIQAGRCGAAHAVVAVRVLRGPWRLLWALTDPLTAVAYDQLTVVAGSGGAAALHAPDLTVDGGPVVACVDGLGMAATPATWAALWEAWHEHATAAARPIDGQLALPYPTPKEQP